MYRERTNIKRGDCSSFFLLSKCEAVPGTIVEPGAMPAPSLSERRFSHGPMNGWTAEKAVWAARRAGASGEETPGTNWGMQTKKHESQA